MREFNATAPKVTVSMARKPPYRVSMPGSINPQARSAGSLRTGTRQRSKHDSLGTFMVLIRTP